MWFMFVSGHLESQVTEGPIETAIGKELRWEELKTE